VISKRIIVEGCVQGVGYREYIVNKAVSIGIAGTVRNLPDGNVEIIAEGTEDKVSSFIRTLESETGKELDGCAGKVTGILADEISLQGFTDFRIKR
jgi:acylphosphatase